MNDIGMRSNVWKCELNTSSEIYMKEKIIDWLTTLIALIHLILSYYTYSILID